MTVIPPPTRKSQFDRTSEERKTLGQFFTGDRLALLLANLAYRAEVQTVIDPMCGSGDMLVAAHQISPSAALFGVDVDPVATEMAQERLNRLKTLTHVMSNSAFDDKLWQSFGNCAYDLVITNPPYVRYQSIAKGGPNLPTLPAMPEIRARLLSAVPAFGHLSEDEQQIFRSLITGYSGLSDLAVPSWLLCAMLVRRGGYLALVVPEAWLSRDYAKPIRYLLHKLFRLRFVVEDTARVWFKDAQVKTTLVVAERVEPTPLANQILGNFVRITLPGSSVSEASIVGNLYPHSRNPDQVFATQAREVLASRNPSEHEDLFHVEPLEQSRATLVGQLARESWFADLEPSLDFQHRERHGSKARPALPPTMAGLGMRLTLDEMLTLESVGYAVGQGLRTGANCFFYWTEQEDLGDWCVLQSGPELGQRIIVPRTMTAPVLRRQSDLPDAHRIERKRLRGRVLLLVGLWPRLTKQPAQTQFDFAMESDLLPDELDRVIRLAETLKVGNDSRSKYIPELSAVRTNISYNPQNRRAWYMLPRLAPRHIPDLFIARVNARSPRVVLNDMTPVVIDANFTTIWRSTRSAPPSPAIAALLSSSWARAYMELEGAVLGGGALKIEATHMRRLPVPPLSERDWSRLSDLGDMLAGVNIKDATEIRSQIDALIGGVLFGPDEQSKSQLLRAMLDDRLKQRLKS